MVVVVVVVLEPPGDRSEDDFCIWQRRDADVVPLPGTLSTRCNRGSERSLHAGTTRRCCLRRAGSSARCGSSPRRSAASEAFFTAGYGIRGYLEGLVGATMKTLSNYVNHAANIPLDAAVQTAKRVA